MAPIVEERSYGVTHDYVIIFDEYLDADFNSKILRAKTWISVRIHKSLNRYKFYPILRGYNMHPQYTDKNYAIYFNKLAYKGLPKINPANKIHEHINVKLMIGGQILKLKPKFARNWYNLSGGVELGEAPVDAAKREIFEELGVHIETQELVATRTKKMCIKIPVVDKPIDTLMYYYELNMDTLPTFKVDKKEISQLKLGGEILIS